MNPLIYGKNLKMGKDIKLANKEIIESILNKLAKILKNLKNIAKFCRL